LRQDKGRTKQEPFAKAFGNLIYTRTRKLRHYRVYINHNVFMMLFMMYSSCIHNIFIMYSLCIHDVFITYSLCVYVY